ncbi:hypothetical protein ABZ897_26565 [Nonomuraea sp. NPDC046802]|uniref:hypothetical protein n=1 Tax=Nonomuraea sp. NPDC046802 TaxID=3154919 RepID=UPI0033EDD44E
MGILSRSSIMAGNRHVLAVAGTLLAGLLMQAVAAGPAAAQLQPTSFSPVSASKIATAASNDTDWVVRSYRRPEPKDDGGRDASVAIRDSETYVRFHAKSEVLSGYTLKGNMFVRVEYRSAVGRRYAWNINWDGPDRNYSNIHLGADGDLGEGNDIKIKLCYDGSDDCSQWAYGTT